MQGFVLFLDRFWEFQSIELRKLLCPFDWDVDQAVRKAEHKFSRDIAKLNPRARKEPIEACLLGFQLQKEDL